jgi:hypothetical protein
MASDRDAAFKPPFVTAASTAGKVWVGWSTRLAVMLMTWPEPCLTICAMARWVMWNKPARLVANIAAKSASA